MHEVSNSLRLEFEIVTKELFTLREFTLRRGGKCNKTDVCGACKISCCICIRTLSSRNRITTDQEGIVEDRAASVVSDGGLALDCRLYSSPFPRLEEYSGY